MCLLIMRMSCKASNPFKDVPRTHDEPRLVFVHDPTDSDGYVIPIGKQTLHPSHIFYTPCSGIWQSVWLESAPGNYIAQLDLNADMDGLGRRRPSVQRVTLTSA